MIPFLENKQILLFGVGLLVSKMLMIQERFQLVFGRYSFYKSCKVWIPKLQNVRKGGTAKSRWSVLKIFKILDLRLISITEHEMEFCDLCIFPFGGLHLLLGVVCILRLGGLHLPLGWLVSSAWGSLHLPLGWVVSSNWGIPHHPSTYWFFIW